MKAALFYGGKDIRIGEVETPVPGPGEVLVKVLAAGICGSDLHPYRRPAEEVTGYSTPVLSGHELAGEIAALGPVVEGLSVGQRVGVEPRHLVCCGQCHWCRRGEYQLCPNLGMRNGQRVHSTGFAEYSLESADKCFPLPENLPTEHAAILDVYAVAVHALQRVPVRPVDTVVVQGVGAIGLAIAQVAKAAGARRVIAIDTHDAPLELATRLGCDGVINATREDVPAAVRDLTGGAGADVVYEAVGGIAPTLAQAVEIVTRGGQIGLVGMFQAPQSLDTWACMHKEVTLRFVWSYGLWDGLPEYKIALDMMAEGRLEVAPLITHRFPLEHIVDAFAAADDKRSSGAVKVLIIPQTPPLPAAVVGTLCQP
jgi:2-desacetyl-2-hydroxyethyl bacteriochlorophyllide A dehydrogenase